MGIINKQLKFQAGNAFFLMLQLN